MAENDETDDLAEFLVSPPEVTAEFEDPRLALARVCLRRSMSAPDIARIAADRHRVVVFEVRQSWEAWVGKAAVELFPGRQLFFAKLTRKGGPDPEDGKRLAQAMARRHGVLAIVTDEVGFPRVMDHLPDIRIRVIEPDVAVLREVARCCLSGNARRITARPVVTDLDVLAACFSPGSSVSTALARLGRLEVSSRVNRRHMPSLSSVRGLDAAKLWGLDLKADLASYRAGDLPFSAVDAGAVLAGPPGTGKTMVARIIAAECELAFVATSIGELFATSDGDLGAVIKRSRQVFSQARDAAPSLLFIDELDALPSRANLSPRNRDWWTPVITEFLTLLDSSLTDRDGVVVLGATNRYADLDPALIRPGRLSHLLKIDPPSIDDLAAILRHHLHDDLANADLRPLALELVGATGAQAADWIKTARRMARNAGRAFDLDDLWSAAIGPETRSAEHLWRTAVHEAGHCLVGHHVGLEPEYATIRRHGNNGGATTFVSTQNPMTQAEVETFVVMLLGGLAAESVILGPEARPLSAGGAEGSDLHVATELLARGHLSHGTGETLIWLGLPERALAVLSRDPKLQDRVEHDLRRLLARAEDTVKGNRNICEQLARHMLETKFIAREDLGRTLGAVSN